MFKCFISTLSISHSSGDNHFVSQGAKSAVIRQIMCLGTPNLGLRGYYNHFILTLIGKFGR